MRTEPIRLDQQSAYKKLEFHDPQGRRQQLEAVFDGGLDHDVWDRVQDTAPQGQFVRTLHDPRLQNDPSPAALGPGWRLDYSRDNTHQTHLVLGSPDGPRQEVTLDAGGRSGGEFSVKTIVPGYAEHTMEGRTTFGELNESYTREQVILDVSPAGTQVFSNGRVLFEMPSAFTGGCTI